MKIIVKKPKMLMLAQTVFLVQVILHRFVYFLICITIIKKSGSYDYHKQWLADNKRYVSFFAVVIIVANIIIVITDGKEKL